MRSGKLIGVIHCSVLFACFAREEKLSKSAVYIGSWMITFELLNAEKKASELINRDVLFPSRLQACLGFLPNWNKCTRRILLPNLTQIHALYA